MAEWLCSGLQSRVRRFDSDPSLHFLISGPGGGIGRRSGLKIRWPQGRAGSSPALGTTIDGGQASVRAESTWATAVAVTLIQCSAAVAAADIDETIDELKRCARIADTPARVACYEALGRRVLADEPVAAPVPVESKKAPPAPPAPVAEAAPPEPAAAPVAPSIPAELGQPKKEEKKKREEPVAYRGHVRSCRETIDGIWYFTFDNGQVWHQSGRGHYRFDSCDFDVTITKDFFGYRMAIDGGKTLRVRRQR